MISRRKFMTAVAVGLAGSQLPKIESNPAAAKLIVDFGNDRTGEAPMRRAPDGGYELAGPILPYQYQTMTIVADNQTGWSYPRARSV